MKIDDQLREAVAIYGITIDVDTVRAHIAMTTSDSELEALCLRDLALAVACLRKDAVALAALEAHVIAPLHAELARLVPDESDREDVLQQLRARILVGKHGHGQLASYAGGGALKSWARVIATRIALNEQRRRKREEPFDHDGVDGEEELASAAFDSDPELAAMKRDRKEDLKRAVRAAFATLTVRERNLLRQSYIDGLSIDELAGLYRVHRATAARWIAQAREAVWAETRRLLVEGMHGSRDEAEAIMVFLQSRLDITLGGLLR